MGHWIVKRLLKRRCHVAFTSSGDIFLISSGVREGMTWGCFGLDCGFPAKKSESDQGGRPLSRDHAVREANHINQRRGDTLECGSGVQLNVRCSHLFQIAFSER